MKNYFVLTLVCLIVFACKKDRVCNCTVTSNVTNTTRTQTPGFPPFFPATDTTVITPQVSVKMQKTTLMDVTKKKADYNCFDKVEDVDDSTPSMVPGTYTINSTNKGTNSYSCKIE